MGQVSEASRHGDGEATRCGCGRQFVEIALEVGGRTLRLRSCSHCDTRQWFGPDGEMALDGVLADISAASAKR